MSVVSYSQHSIIRPILFRSQGVSFVRNIQADPPYDSYDTIIRQELDIRNITRIRFLEEWRFDNKNHLIDKKILGMAPMTESYDPDGNLRGYEALFWIYEDEKVPFVR